MSQEVHPVAGTFDAIEQRVLGVLVEKALTQPDYYPMTLNAIVTAANQKNNRDPVMDLDEEAVWQALERLRGRGVVARVLPAPGARAERFRHELREAMDWGPRQQAVMAELFLRGPQTVGELRGRCARMHDFESLDVVTQTINDLASRQPPCAGPLPREAGRSAIRYAHCLYPEGEGPAVASAASHEPRPLARAAQEATAPAAVRQSAAAHLQPAARSADDASPAPVSGGDVDLLREELENLQAELADLHQELAALRRRVDALESRQL